MMTVLKWVARLVVLLVVLGLGIYFFGPRDPVVTDVAFDETVLGDDLDAYLAESERAFDDIVPGTEKAIVWAGESGAKAPLALVYFHGYSASRRELSPVAENVASALGANLYFTRFPGHGRGEAAMAEPLVEDWMGAAAEAMAIARRIGDDVILIGTSTGGTIATLAAAEPSMNAGLAAMVLVAPNFAVANQGSQLATLPYARTWLPWVAGKERSWTPRNDAQATFWTTTYPIQSVVTLANTVDAAMAVDYAAIETPVLAIFRDDDRVVRADVTRDVLERWGGPVEIFQPDLGPEDDEMHHVIAGDIVSPGQTEVVTQVILDWIGGLAR